LTGVQDLSSGFRTKKKSEWKKEGGRVEDCENTNMKEKMQVVINKKKKRTNVFNAAGGPSRTSKSGGREAIEKNSRKGGGSTAAEVELP